MESSHSINSGAGMTMWHLFWFCLAAAPYSGRRGWWAGGRWCWRQNRRK